MKIQESPNLPPFRLVGALLLFLFGFIGAFYCDAISFKGSAFRGKIFFFAGFPGSGCFL